MKKILVTGGAGYIGSHTVVQLLNSGQEIVILDNLSNSSSGVIQRIEGLTGKVVEFVKGDIRDRALVRATFEQYAFDSVMHFAGLKAVGESEAFPLKYFDNNVSGSIVLFEEMMRANVNQLIFSSSATVYGEPVFLPYTEEHPLKPINVYGQTKLMVEHILRDLSISDSSWSIALLRYFNPVGAHPTANIGELPLGVPQNLVPFITQTAIGLRNELSVFGDDYNTPDGTCVRDYIHVVDLAKAHVVALQRLIESRNLDKVEVFNLGTGKGNSVLEVIKAFEKASGQKLNYKIVPRRAGDITEAYADTTKANNVLGWKAELSLDDALASAWKWEQKVRS